MIRAMTFDFWNTLYGDPRNKDVLERRVERFYKVLKGEGFRYTRQAILEAFRACWGKAHYEQRVNGREMTPLGHLEYIKKKLSLRSNALLDGELYQAYTQVMLDVPPTLNDGVPEVLKELSTRYRLAVICNTGATPGVILRKIMKADGIYSYFNVTVFSDEVGWAKPNTRIFMYTLSRISVQPTEAVHVGDDGITDVIGAKKAGMKVVWFCPGAKWALPECDWHIRRMPELLDLFLD